MRETEVKDNNNELSTEEIKEVKQEPPLTEEELKAARDAEHGWKNLDEKRTAETKKKFLDEWKVSTPIVRTVCEKIDISLTTYYRWYESDPEFRAEIERSKQRTITLVEDIFMESLLTERNKEDIRFFLKTHSHRFKEKSSIELKGAVAVGVTSFEEALRLSEARLNGEHAGDAQGAPTLDESRTNRDGLEDQEQAQGDRAIQIEQVAASLLGKEDATQSDS